MLYPAFFCPPRFVYLWGQRPCFTPLWNNTSEGKHIFWLIDARHSWNSFAYKCVTHQNIVLKTVITWRNVSQLGSRRVEIQTQAQPGGPRAPALEDYTLRLANYDSWGKSYCLVPGFTNKVLLELYWNTALHLHIYGCFTATMVELNSYNRNHMAHGPQTPRYFPAGSLQRTFDHLALWPSLEASHAYLLEFTAYFKKAGMMISLLWLRNTDLRREVK